MGGLGVDADSGYRGGVCGELSPPNLVSAVALVACCYYYNFVFPSRFCYFIHVRQRSIASRCGREGCLLMFVELASVWLVGLGFSRVREKWQRHSFMLYQRLIAVRDRLVGTFPNSISSTASTTAHAHASPVFSLFRRLSSKSKST